jgi:hypothetical protein
MDVQIKTMEALQLCEKVSHKKGKANLKYVAKFKLELGIILTTYDNLTKIFNKFIDQLK